MRRTLIALSFILVLVAGTFGGATVAHAETTGQFQFKPIVSIPLPTGSGAVDASTSLTDYLNAVFALSIGIAAILGVIMITFEGLKYMTSDVVGKKQSAVEGIQGAALGLTLLLLSYIILNVINPEILNLKALTEDLSALGGSGANQSVQAIQATSAADCSSKGGTATGQAPNIICTVPITSPAAVAATACTQFTGFMVVSAGNSCAVFASENHSKVADQCCAGMTAGNQCCAKGK